MLFASSSAYAGEGHDAGYEWAEKYDIRDENYSNGNSESFNEGVREYAEEMQEQEKGEEENEEEVESYWMLFNSLSIFTIY